MNRLQTKKDKAKIKKWDILLNGFTFLNSASRKVARKEKNKWKQKKINAHSEDIQGIIYAMRNVKTDVKWKGNN